MDKSLEPANQKIERLTALVNGAKSLLLSHIGHCLIKRCSRTHHCPVCIEDGKMIDMIEQEVE